MNKIRKRVHALTFIQSDGGIKQRGKKRAGEKSAYLAICSNYEYENHAICTFVRKMHVSCRHQSLLSSDVTFSPSWLRRILSAGYDALKPDINLQAFLRNVLPPYTIFALLYRRYVLILFFIYTLISKVVSFLQVLQLRVYILSSTLTYTFHERLTSRTSHHHHHKHQGLDPLIRSVFKVTTAISNVSSVFQLFSFIVVCSSMTSKGFGFVAFFASVETSSFCIHLSCLVCL